MDSQNAQQTPMDSATSSKEGLPNTDNKLTVELLCLYVKQDPQLIEIILQYMHKFTSLDEFQVLDQILKFQQKTFFEYLEKKHSGELRMLLGTYLPFSILNCQAILLDGSRAGKKCSKELGYPKGYPGKNYFVCYDCQVAGRGASQVPTWNDAFDQKILKEISPDYDERSAMNCIGYQPIIHPLAIHNATGFVCNLHGHVLGKFDSATYRVRPLMMADFLNNKSKLITHHDGDTEIIVGKWNAETYSVEPLTITDLVPSKK